MTFRTHNQTSYVLDTQRQQQGGGTTLLGQTFSDGDND